MGGFTHFAHPAWLAAALAAAVILALLYGLFDRGQLRRAAAFSLLRPPPAARRRLWLKRVLFTLAVACLCLTLAAPQGALQLVPTEQRGIDILFAIDTSRSMLTPDVKPDRLTRAKLAVEDLLERLDGDGVGLIAFAGDAFLQAPITSDYDAFRETLEALDTHTIAHGGTDIASAISLATRTLSAQSADRILVLVTDGEDLGGEAVEAAQAAGKAGLSIYTVGVGTSAGELIPVLDGNGGTEFVKDESGNYVRSRLDERTLRRIAAAAGGSYWPLGAAGQGMTQLYDQVLGRRTRHEISRREVAVYAQLFQWPLGCAIALLVLEWLVRTGGRVGAALPERAGARAGSAVVVPGGRRARPAVPRAVRAGRAAVLALATVAGAGALTRAEASARAAHEAYARGDYALAAREYSDSAKRQPADARLQFDLGAAAYKAGDYPRAVEAFNRALSGGDVPLQQSSYYNLGNTLYRTGAAARTADPPSAIRSWQQAVQAYDAALQLSATDADARFNRDFVQKKLEELQRQQNQSQQNRRNDQNQQHQQNQQNQPNGQDQRNQQNQQGQQSPQGQQNQNARQNQGNQPNQPNQQNQQNQQGQGQSNAGQDRHPPDGRGGQGPQRPDSNPAAGSAAGSDRDREGQGAAPRPQPGQMTRADAEQLLESARGEERHMVIGGANSGSSGAPLPVRDW